MLLRDPRKRRIVDFWTLWQGQMATSRHVDVDQRKAQPYPKAPCSCMVYTSTAQLWQALAHKPFRVQVCTIRLHGAFGLKRCARPPQFTVTLMSCLRRAQIPELGKATRTKPAPLKCKPVRQIQPKGPCTSTVYTWALNGFLNPYFAGYVSAIMLYGPFGTWTWLT